MTLGQIIKAYRETNSMSMDDFSKASKISKGYISQLENNLNPKTGEPPVPSIQSIKKAANGMFMTFDELFSQLDNNTKVDAEPEKVKMAKKAIRIPVLGNVAAGVPIEAIEDVIDYEEISEELAHTGDLFHGTSYLQWGCCDCPQTELCRIRRSCHCVSQWRQCHLQKVGKVP